MQENNKYFTTSKNSYLAIPIHTFDKQDSALGILNYKIKRKGNSLYSHIKCETLSTSQATETNRLIN